MNEPRRQASARAVRLRVAGALLALGAGAAALIVAIVLVQQTLA